MYTRRNFLKAGVLVSGMLPTGAWWERAAIRHADEFTALKHCLENPAPTVWVFTGDSITQGAKHTHGERSYPEVFAERVRWELGRVRDVVINTAVSGNTTVDLLADVKWRIDHFKPNVVSLMMGTNDCATEKKINIHEFEENLSSAVTHIRQQGAIPLLHVPTPIVVAKAPERAQLPAYAERVRMVAAREEVLLVDHWTHWQEAIRQKGDAWVFDAWMNDPLHPNGAGHLEMARLLFRSIQVFDESAATCGAPYYEGEH